jgi:lipoprotein signal peptidase
MEKHRIFLKILLILTSASVVMHLYISISHAKICYWNEGLVLGTFAFLPVLLINFLMIIFLVLIVYLLWKNFSKIRQYWELIAILVVASLGNIVDRIINDSICDYIKIFRLPIFNLNDIFISISLLTIFTLLIYDAISSRKKR